ncbi:hypothetical protein N7519_001047 [Penicillium mononematosum]|uniref:uncharacterized protein n=1 Tax=Penicillium mononematosum TaxID=268346 RepID=UPI002546CD57|nr:uncharacterized protein N7519_001047 [Penicillium mononematosum]KAJ6191026.1 hypothetical protein N7519_001047 [Penicillium mononematosum]
MESVSHLPAILCCFLGVLGLHFIYKRLSSPLARLPGPAISNWTDLVYIRYWFAGKVPYYVHDLHEKYGPIVRNGPNRVDICDIDAVKEIHKTNSRFLKSPWYRTLLPNGMENVFSTTDPHFHSHRRRLLASPISDTSLHQHEDLITGRVKMTISRMAEEMQDRGTTDVFKWWLFMATDIIGELSFGESFRMLEAGKKTQYTLDLERIASLQPIRTTFPNLVYFGKYLPLPVFKRTIKTGKRMISYTSQSIDRYNKMITENPSNPKKTLFTKLFDTEKGGLTPEEIKNEAQGYIVAGSDTTAVTLTYLTYAVCGNKQIRDKLVAEVAALSEPIHDNDLRSLPYLNMVISETLRLHTAVPFGLPRAVPSGGASFKGYFLPSGATVSTQSYSLHRDPTVFPDPDTFNPERWENPTKEMKDISIPFGGGSRICIGMHLARMELRLGSALFFREFRNAQRSNKEEMTEKDMEMQSFLLMAPKGHRCLIETN